MPLQLAARMDTIDQQEIPAVSNINPQRVIVREIDIRLQGNTFDFFFNQPDQAHPVGNLQNIITEIIQTGTHTRVTPVAASHRPLDLNVTSASYIVFYLSRTWNWRFCHKYRGVTLGQYVALPYYGELFHVIAGYAHSATPIAHNQGDCKLVYFKASPPLPNPPGFADSMNINLEIVRPDVPNEPPNTTPFVLDPDIRNPGGSTS